MLFDIMCNDMRQRYLSIWTTLNWYIHIDTEWQHFDLLYMIFMHVVVTTTTTLRVAHTKRRKTEERMDERKTIFANVSNLLALN